MMKKNGIIVGLALIIFAVIIGLIYTNLTTVKKYFNKTFGINQEISYEYNYIFSGFIDENGKKQKIDGLLDMGIYAKDKGLKERLIVKKFQFKLSGDSENETMFIKGLDIIEDEYKKYIKIDNAYSVENGKKEYVNESFDGFKTGTYYLLDDTVFKNNLGKIYNQELVKIFLRSLLTSNLTYYLRKNKFSEKLKASLFSQKLAQKLFPKVGDNYVLTDKICSNDLNCKQLIKEINNNFAIIWKKDSLIIQPKGLAAAVGKLQIDYKNKILDKISLNFANVGEIVLDKDGFKKIDVNFVDKKGGKVIISYERGKKVLFIDIYLVTPNGTIIKGNYKDDKGIFSVINKSLGQNLNISINNSVLDFKFNNSKINENIKGKLDFNKGIYIVLANVKGIKILDFNLNTKTYEGNFNLHVPNIVNIDISSKKEKENILLKGNGDIVQKNYYGETKHSFNLDFKINKKETVGNLVVDDAKLNVNAKYGKKYDIKVSALLGDNKGNLNIKGEGFKGKTVLNINDKQILSGNYDIGDYDYYLGFKKINLDFNLNIPGQDTWKVKVFRNVVDNKDNIKLDIKNGKNILKFEAKGKIKEGTIKYEVPKKFEKMPEKGQIYALIGLFYTNYSLALPNFDYEAVKESRKLILDGIVNTKYIVGGLFVIGGISGLASYEYYKAKYSKLQEIASKLAIMTSINSKPSDLVSIRVCDDLNGKIMYDARTGMYGLVCKGITEKEKDRIRDIKGVKEVDCSNSPGVLSGVANMCYYVNR